MIRIRTDGEKFSAGCAYRVLGVFARNKKCTIKEVCAECGISKMTGGRVFRLLEREGLIRKYPYHEISGRGARPTHYVLNPKSVAAVLDLRPGTEELSLLFPPRYRKITVAPRIFSSKEISQKRDMLTESFPDLAKDLLPEKHLLSLSVITDDADGVRQTVPDGTFFFTPEELEALWTEERFPGKSVLLIFADADRTKLSLCRGGDRVVLEIIMPDEADTSERVASLCAEYCPDGIHVISPALTLHDRDDFLVRLRDAGTDENISISFSDGRTFDLSYVAAKASIDALTGGKIHDREVQTI